MLQEVDLKILKLSKLEKLILNACTIFGSSLQSNQDLGFEQIAQKSQ